MKPEPLIVTPETRADAIHAIGVNVTVLATNEQTRSYEITLQQGDDGVGPPPHRHDWDESFYVLAGSVDITVAGNTFHCERGTLVHVPAGTVHGYRFGTEGGEMFEIAGRGGHATRMFADLACRIPPGPPELELVAHTLAEHGVTLAAP